MHKQDTASERHIKNGLLYSDRKTLCTGWLNMIKSN